MSAEVFISYASEDRSRILDLVERLRKADVSVWIDQMGIEGATMWTQEIVEIDQPSDVCGLNLNN